MLSGLDLLFALAAVFAGATVMGTVGFGFGLVVAPVLLLFLDPQPAVVTINSIIALLMIIVLAQTRSFLNPRLAWGLAFGGLAAAPIGVLALNSAGPTVLRLAVAVLVVVLALLTLLNLPLPLAGRRGSGPVVGFITSLSITTLSIGGPLAALFVVAQGSTRDATRATLALYFLISYTTAIALYWPGAQPCSACTK